MRPAVTASCGSPSPSANRPSRARSRSTEPLEFERRFAMNDRTDVTKTTEQAPRVPESALAPAVDISENDVGIELVADLPGVPKDGLSVKVDGANLTIEGSAQIDVPQNLEPIYGEI